MVSNDYSSDGYGRMFHEHLDTIVVRKDGKTMISWDIAKIFHKLQFEDSFTRDEKVFQQWKSKTAQMRKARGLRVLETKGMA